jgi:hypothetical protein
MTDDSPKPPEELNRIVKVVLAYRPKPKSKPAKARARARYKVDARKKAEVTCSPKKNSH